MVVDKGGLVLARKAGQSVYLGRQLDRNALEETYSVRVTVERIYNTASPAVVLHILCGPEGALGDFNFMLTEKHTKPIEVAGVLIFFMGVSSGEAEHGKCYACNSEVQHSQKWVDARIRFVADSSIKIFRGSTFAG